MRGGSSARTQEHDGERRFGAAGAGRRERGRPTLPQNVAVGRRNARRFRCGKRRHEGSTDDAGLRDSYVTAIRSPLMMFPADGKSAPTAPPMGRIPGDVLPHRNVIFGVWLVLCDHEHMTLCGPFRGTTEPRPKFLTRAGFGRVREDPSAPTSSRSTNKPPVSAPMPPGGDATSCPLVPGVPGSRPRITASPPTSCPHGSRRGDSGRGPGSLPPRGR